MSLLGCCSEITLKEGFREGVHGYLVPRRAPTNHHQRGQLLGETFQAAFSPLKSFKLSPRKALLAPATSSRLFYEQQKQQKDAAFDLLDAITKSGALPLSRSALHIVIASTHCFDKTVTETAAWSRLAHRRPQVIQDNINPIERVERASCIMASLVHQQPLKHMLREVLLHVMSLAASLRTRSPDLRPAAPCYWRMPPTSCVWKQA